MARTLLQLVQQATLELGIPSPQFLFNNTNEMEQQLLALAQREGKDLCSVANKNGGWQALHKEYTFNTEVLNTTASTTADSNIIDFSAPVVLTTEWGLTGYGFPANTRVTSVNSPTQVTVSAPCADTQVLVPMMLGRMAYDLPSDLEYFLEKTYWDNKFKWALMGPITAQEKQILRYGVIASGPRSKFYFRVNKMWFDPIPYEVNLIAYDYLSRNWCTSVAGADQALWGADTDTFKLDEECFIYGLKWRFLRMKGMDYTQEENDYQEEVNKTISRDGGSRDLSLNSSGYAVQFLDGSNVPETGFGNVNQ